MTKKSDAQMQEVKQPNVNELNDAPLPDGGSGVDGSNDPDGPDISNGKSTSYQSASDDQTKERLVDMLACERIAKVCYQAMKAYSEVSGGESRPNWESLPDPEIKHNTEKVADAIETGIKKPADGFFHGGDASIKIYFMIIDSMKDTAILK